MSQSQGLRRERIVASPQRDPKSGRFRNISGLGPELQGDKLPVIGEYFFGGSEHRFPPAALPLERPHELWTRAPESGLRVTWLGHSTLLLEVDGLRILTDPVFGKRASPVQFAGPKRFHPPPASIAELPPIDVVLLSHDHYDHLCSSSVRELAKLDVPFVTALGVGGRLEDHGVRPERVHELDWHEHVTVGAQAGRGARFTATPAQHFSGRGLGDRNTTLWASWVIETERHKVFFSGDTGLFPELSDIGKKYGPFDLVLLEIGAFHPSWGHIHLGPENALKAFHLLGGSGPSERGLFMPVHWGTFNLGLHAWDEPAETLVRLAHEQSTRLFLPRLGAPTEPSRIERVLPWWREVGQEPAPAPGQAPQAAGGLDPLR